MYTSRKCLNDSYIDDDEMSTLTVEGRANKLLLSTPNAKKIFTVWNRLLEVSVCVLQMLADEMISPKQVQRRSISYPIIQPSILKLSYRKQFMDFAIRRRHFFLSMNRIFCTTISVGAYISSWWRDPNDGCNSNNCRCCHSSNRRPTCVKNWGITEKKDYE